VSDVRLHALDRQYFLDAVSGNPISQRAVDALIDLRAGAFRAGLATVSKQDIETMSTPDVHQKDSPGVCVEIYTAVASDPTS
jgi:hypothetical protein